MQFNRSATRRQHRVQSRGRCRRCRVPVAAPSRPHRCNASSRSSDPRSTSASRFCSPRHLSRHVSRSSRSGLDSPRTISQQADDLLIPEFGHHLHHRPTREEANRRREGFEDRQCFRRQFRHPFLDPLDPFEERLHLVPRHHPRSGPIGVDRKGALDDPARCRHPSPRGQGADALPIVDRAIGIGGGRDVVQVMTAMVTEYLQGANP